MLTLISGVGVGGVRVRYSAKSQQQDSLSVSPALVEAALRDVDVKMFVQVGRLLQHGQHSSRPSVNQQFLKSLKKKYFEYRGDLNTIL